MPTSGPLTCEAQLQQEYGSAGFVNGPASFKSDNIWNKRALLNNATQDAVNLSTFNRVAVSQPRTVGVDLNYRFGGT